MAKRKKSGDARSDAIQSQSRQGGRTRTTASSGTEPDEHHSTIVFPVELAISDKCVAGENSEPTQTPTQLIANGLTQTMYPFKVSEPYYSVARQEWRIECYEKWGPTFQQEKISHLSFDTRGEAEAARESLKDVKDWKSWEGVAAAIKRSRI